MSKQDVIICRNLETDLQQAVAQCPHDKLFILTDENIPINIVFLCLNSCLFLKMQPKYVSEQKMCTRIWIP